MFSFVIVMKTKTKEFVAKLKDEHAESVAALTLKVQQREAILLQACNHCILTPLFIFKSDYRIC